ncbi:MAG: response regulator transcription factor [Gemmatimonadetes bacterium]|nr:response regulator transcription factor [Gemmatimonadota bacterium]
MIKILIADDHPVVREGVRRILGEGRDFTVVGETADGRELVKLVGKTQPDVVLLDLTMPGPGFMDVLEGVKTAKPGVKVLVVSAHAEEQYAMRVLKAGAAGYLAKNHSPEQLVGAIRAVVKSGRYVSSELAGQMAAELTGERSGSPHERLSNREYQILALLGAGKSVKEIAGQLSLSPKTVSTYRTRLMEKLKLKTTADIIRYAVENHIAA